ncbi:MAG: hypothetical protein IPP94_11315 [Ignavibacteria bacterium]|nr:hypothetical protein [Ignavibacteria bacterium]
MKTLRCLFLVCSHVLLLRGTAAAQWVPTNGPYLTAIDCGSALPNPAGGINIIATHFMNGMTGSNVLLSRDNGASWSAINLRTPTTRVKAFAAHGTTLAAGTEAGVFISTDAGEHWRGVNNGLPDLSIKTVAFVPDGAAGLILYAAVGTHGIYRSLDTGAHWSAVNEACPT